MTLVRIIKDWNWPDIFRQTPGHYGVWEGIRFTEEPVEECDYAVVLNFSRKRERIFCPPENLWLILQEPPVGTRRAWHSPPKVFKKAFVQDAAVKGKRIVHSHGALPWHVDRGYDFLSKFARPEKTKVMSWITSDKRGYPGQADRMNFLERIRSKVEFDLFGRGFAEIKDKFDALAPYRYSLAVESCRGSHYWTEKISDCFLAWTMPIYSGAPNIAEYFPVGSFVPIDINAPDAAERVDEIVSGDSYERHIDAISEARDLVLNRYQLFPFLAENIHLHEKKKTAFKKKILTIPAGAGAGNTLISRGLSKLKKKLFQK